MQGLASGAAVISSSMSIDDAYPVADYKLAEIEQLAADVATALLVLRHCPGADVPQVRE